MAKYVMIGALSLVAMVCVYAFVAYTIPAVLAVVPLTTLVVVKGIVAPIALGGVCAAQAACMALSDDCG